MIHVLTLNEDHVGKAFIKINGRQRSVTDFMGKVLPGDVGKQVFEKDGVLSVENDEQRDRRIEKQRQFAKPLTAKLGDESTAILEGAQRDLRSLVTLLRSGADDIERYVEQGATAELIFLEPSIASMVQDSARALFHVMGNASSRLPIGAIEEFAHSVRKHGEVMS